ncbi:translation initiation factor eIF-2B subunit delta [Cataglyphis hispanica]|uniref:translation initiation factor eIF-2B subunit delta n=1 Tax=Cataglyphis hispanica TaxID=1086592 RepID=UPI00218063FC|nr:translation initiation factor eIF-2B subunit delta [Cataglyphis hispanica]
MNFPQKTREEIKAEREAKKAAKAAAKVTKGKNVSKVAEAHNNVKNVSPVTNCKIPQKNVERNTAGKNDNKVAETDIKNKSNAANCDNSGKSTKTVAPTVRDSQPTKEVSKENTIQSSNVVMQNCASESKSKESIGEKSKAELRAERRAKQEAQRAAKQQQLLAKDNSKTKESIKPCVEIKSECAIKKEVTKSVAKEDPHQLSLFKHLYHERKVSRIDVAPVNSNIHPAIVRLGVQYANKIIVGSNARCIALLATIKQMVQDFEKPAQADFIRGFETSLQQSLAYLHHCRPLAVSQHNAMRHLKWQMTRFSSLSDEKVKNKLQGIIDTYISEQIDLADKAISITIRKKISNGNVILTYGYSSLIYKILVEAHDAGKQFRVIVVDGRPWLEGKEQLRRLAKHGIECSYILINALSFIMPEVSKVFLGAHAILANGAVMSRAGTAQVALIAKTFNVPVLVACETHKSSERVQTDSIVYNELGNAEELVNHQSKDKTKKSLLSNWRTKKSLNLLNITYDVTPADLVTAVVTELAILPCTSVPVILRIKPSEI